MATKTFPRMIKGNERCDQPRWWSIPTPPATETHRPIPHHEIVQALIETLGFRHIGVVHDEYAVSPDGMKMFGVLDLATEMNGCRLSAESRIMPTLLGQCRGRGANRFVSWHNQRPSRKARS